MAPENGWETFPAVFYALNKNWRLRLGRFISVPGIEAQLAPNNYIFSHSLLYAIDPFTDTGLIATVKLSAQWLVQLGTARLATMSRRGLRMLSFGAPPASSYTTKSANDGL